MSWENVIIDTPKVDSGKWYIVFTKDFVMVRIHESSFVNHQEELNKIIDEKRLIAIVENIGGNDEK